MRAMTAVEGCISSKQSPASGAFGASATARRYGPYSLSRKGHDRNLSPTALDGDEKLSPRALGLIHPPVPALIQDAALSRA
jgi:hypothetical protein